MAILPGLRLGPYEILSAIGAGGMGEVYRAKDTRLGRIVAIKVLPTHLADSPELKERLEREARTIASLNHPHICALYDIGHQDGTDFLVMEYLEGETLAQRLVKGPLPLDQVLQYAIEIADALDKAHRKGVTHRDLKPGNIMLTKSGTKLLDFGLAKLKQEVAPANVQLSQVPTANDPLTAQGTIVGTLQYMAPEQLEGKEADARTDIFAFGAVVYEMATGRRAFEGKSQASVIAAILEREPPAISSLQPMTPPALDRVVKRCLAKEPDERWQSANDLANELKWIAKGGSQVTSVPTAAVKGIRSFGPQALILSLGALVLIAGLSGLAVWNLQPAPTKPVTRTVINLPPGDRLAALDYPAVAISPDGTQVAYVAVHSGIRQIYLRLLDSLEARPLADTEGANTPFFSPDGQWLGFFARGSLKKISVVGGAALTLANVGDARGASWTNGGTIVFTPNGTSVVQQVSDAGGSAQAATTFETGETGHRFPAFVPIGQAVLFGTTGASRIAVQSLRSRERHDLAGGQLFQSPQYAVSGHLIYAQGSNLMAAAFDPKGLQLTSSAVPVLQGILEVNAGGAQYSLSATGTLAYVPGGSQAEEKLVWVNRNGTEQAIDAPPHVYVYPRISPDGRRLAVAVAEQESQLWVYDFGRETLTRFTFAGTNNTAPAWTPDGKRIAFESNQEGPTNLFWQLADGSGGLERLTTGETPRLPRSFSPDGQRLAFIEVTNTGASIWMLRLSDRKAEPFIRTAFGESVPDFSPDGRWLAYVSNEFGLTQVYVQPYPGPGGKYQIATEGGTEPVWNPNGRELFYRSGEKLMAADITTQPSFSVGKPKMLFEGPYVLDALTFPYYDVSPDGQRFLMIKPSEQTTSLTQIVVVQNWFEELKQKVPTGKK